MINKKITFNIFFLLNIILIYLLLCFKASSDSFVKLGNNDAKIKIIIFESLTCSHCANFHKNVYPDLKKEFIDRGILSIEYKSFPLNIAALNASKLAHCNNDGNSKLLHFSMCNPGTQTDFIRS